MKRECRRDDRLIKGISSIDDICLITLSGTSLVGIVGIDNRIFKVLAEENISAFLVSQSASETGITIGVSRRDAVPAAEVIDREFAHEIESGAILPVQVEYELAAVAVVGENMKYHGAPKARRRATFPSLSTGRTSGRR